MHVTTLTLHSLLLVVTGVAGEFTLLLLQVISHTSIADPIDWVNINYAVKQAKSSGSTSNAQSSIASKAGSTAQDGPWSASFVCAFLQLY